ncbi:MULTISPECIES: hypothetical protein [unclassified Streptomyces]|uniref:hypothetical protein n=1 Tax=unclassified Streptomyces TaxID=2593676 RepID=UPI00081D80B7|nr:MULTISPECIES: hypothetical protein [unclassified Streptomyces]MYZ37737.1 hypothetical protein [Streptomyces sp. SID4917]SCF93641.1 hypothetical protein GA0115259_105146 [Streptomyces sp. MnatMP-M17]
MSSSVRQGFLVPAIAFIVLAGVGAPAHAIGASLPSVASADEPDVVNTEPPAEPEEPDLGDPGPDPEPDPIETGKPPVDTPQAPYCGPTQRIYTPSTKGATYHKGVGPTNSNYNGTSQTARSTFTSEVTGEVGVSVTAGLSTSVDVMITKIEAKYEVNLSAKITAKLGNTIAVNTPPKKSTHAKYGVYRLKNTGTSYIIYSNCQVTPKKTITSYIPARVGWYLWES